MERKLKDVETPLALYEKNKVPTDEQTSTQHDHEPYMIVYKLASNIHGVSGSLIKHGGFRSVTRWAVLDNGVIRLQKSANDDKEAITVSLVDSRCNVIPDKAKKPTFEIVTNNSYVSLAISTFIIIEHLHSQQRVLNNVIHGLDV